jgi:hypothetical protein
MFCCQKWALLPYKEVFIDSSRAILYNWSRHNLPLTVKVVVVALAVDAEVAEEVL